MRAWMINGTASPFIQFMYLHLQNHLEMRVLTIFCFLIATGSALAQNPLAGNYTINAALPTGGTNFQSFNDLADSLEILGLSAPVTATVEPGSGPYTEQAVFQNIAGLGPDATLTIDGSGEVLTAITNTTDRHVLRLANLSYVTVQNLRVNWDPASTGGFYGIHIFGTGSHISVVGCEIDITGANSTLYGSIVASGSTTSILTGGDFSNLTISGNLTMGGGYGVSVFGLSGNNLAENVLIQNNTILDFHSNGIYIRETDGVVIRDNFFDKTTSNITSVNAIQLAQAENINGRIYNNVIQVSQTANGTVTFRGIYLFNGTGHRVYNNVIHQVKLTSGNFTGIEVRTGGTAPEIYFNTIVLDNPTPSSGNLFGIKEELSNTFSVLRNNLIFLGQSTSGQKSALVLATSSIVNTALNSNRNIFWAPGGNVAQKGTLTTPTFYPDLAIWQGASNQDANSLVLDPLFELPELPRPTNILADDQGEPITGILTDILGMPRGEIPDIGAYEFGACEPGIPVLEAFETAVCAGQDSVLFALEPNPDAINFDWSVSGDALILDGQGTSAILVAFGSQSAVVSVSLEDDCGVSASIFLNVTVHPNPVVTFDLPTDTLCNNIGGTLTLEGADPAGGIFEGPGVNGDLFDPLTAGPGWQTITYSYTDAQGCSGSAADSIFVLECSSVKNTLPPNWKIFPNPASDWIEVQFSEGQAIALELLDQTGRIVRSVNTNRLFCGNLPAGTYFLRIAWNKQTFTEILWIN